MIPIRFYFIILLGLPFSEEKNIPKAKNICETDACKKTANQILVYMDPTVEPCEDFYQFACGRFINTAEIHNDKTENSSFSEVDLKVEEQLKNVISKPSSLNESSPFRSLKHLFSLCMDEEKMDARGVGPALDKLKAAGGWPVLGNWSGKYWHFIDTYLLLRHLMIGHNSLFQIYVEVDMKNTSRRLLQVDQPSLGLAQELLVEGRKNLVVQAYFSLMIDIAVMLGADRKTALDQLRSSLKFEIEIAKIMTVKEERRNFTRMYNLYKLSDLLQHVGWNWRSLVQMIVPGSVNIKQDELINVIEVGYLKKLKQLILTHPPRVVANYMMWHAVRDMLNLLTNEMRDRYQQFTNILLGTETRQPRWRECMIAVDGLTTALSSLYVKQFFDKTSKKVASEMTEIIRKETITLIKGVDWMDQQTRKKAAYKASQIVQHIGYPEELTDSRKIEELYKGLVLNKNHFFEAYFDMAIWDDQQNLRRLKEAVNKSDWRTHGDVATANAWYNPSENSMMFPAGILQPPFFDANVPKYVNFARIGSVVGHEIIHGFDDQGSQFDSKGNLHNWWDEQSNTNFNNKKQCMIDQYNSFKDNQTQMNMNGVNTQGENMADSAGLKLAYQAYKKLKVKEPGLPNLTHYNSDQLFMLCAANMWCSRSRLEALKMMIMEDVHALSEFRVKGPVINLQEFGKIFQCKPGAPMNPQTKCPVW